MGQTQNDDDQTGVLSNHMYDTRSLSMANTTIADLNGWPSIGINAALSGLLTKPSFIQFNSLYNWENNLMQYDLTLPTLVNGTHHITTRFGYFHQGFDILPFTSPSSLPEPVIRLHRAELAYAIAISDYFSLGTLQSISYTVSSDETRKWNYFADVGLVYAPDGSVSYGIVFRGLGHETTYKIIENGQTTLGSREARKILEAGVTFRYPTEERTWLSISIANEKRFGEDGVWYKGGVEIIPVSAIYVRGGVMANFNHKTFTPRIGLGINANVLQINYMLQFDYTIAPENLIGIQFHQLGLIIQL